MSNQDNNPGINAGLGYMNKLCAGLAVGLLNNVKAQRWVAERFPNELKYSGPRILTMNGETDWLLDHDESHDYYERYKGNPVFEEACARRHRLDAKARVGLCNGEKVVIYSLKSTPDDFDLIIDWLNAMNECNRVVFLILPALSWARVAEMARDWDRERNRGIAA